MDQYSTPKADPPEKITAKMARKAIIRQAIEKVETDNAAKKDERNSKRWRAERKNPDGTDTPDYAADKASKRDEYAAEVEADGCTVRAYKKVEGATPAEVEANRRERRRAKDRERKAKAKEGQPITQADKDRAADAVWRSDARKRGLTDQEVEAGIVKLHAKRAQKRVNQKHDHDAPYADNPHFGMF